MKIYNVSKVETWMKKAAKNEKLIYDAENELISDTFCVLKAEKEMLPVIMKLFGNLDGGNLFRTGYQKEFPSLKKYISYDTEELVVNTKLVYKGKDKDGKNKDYRIFRNVRDNKVLVPELYIELFNDFENAWCYGAGPDRKAIAVEVNGDWAGLLMPMLPGRIYDELAIINFA